MVLGFITPPTCRPRTFNGTRRLFGMTRASGSNSWLPARLSCRRAAIRLSLPGTGHSSTSVIPTPTPRPMARGRGKTCPRAFRSIMPRRTPSFLVGLADYWGRENSGYSTDGGQTGICSPAFRTGASSRFIGGTIAASTPTNIIWAPPVVCSPITPSMEARLGTHHSAGCLQLECL